MGVVRIVRNLATGTQRSTTLTALQCVSFRNGTERLIEGFRPNKIKTSQKDRDELREVKLAWRAEQRKADPTFKAKKHRPR